MNKINYYRFCCRIRVADGYADEVPGGDFLAVEVGDLRERHEQFAEERIGEFSDWFRESPALLAHIRALQTDRDPDVRKRLVDTEAACLYVKRDAQTIYRWAREGRITRYQIGATMIRGWDVLELEAVRKNLQKNP